MNNLDQTMIEIIRGWAGEALKAKNILNQNGANLAFLHGKDMANKLGLKDEEIAHIMPYPGKNVISINEQSTQQDDPLDVKALLERLAKLGENSPNGGTPNGGTPNGGTPNGGTPNGGTPNGAPQKSLLRRWGPALALAAGTGLGGAGLAYWLTPSSTGDTYINNQGEVGFTVE